MSDWEQLGGGIATLLNATELVIVIVIAIPCSGDYGMCYEYLAVKDT